MAAFPATRHSLVAAIRSDRTDQRRSAFDTLVTAYWTPVFATKVRSLALGTLFGLVVGAFFAYLIVLMNPGHALNIMLPGSLVGVIVGYAAQKHGS
jgi:hypothetical protein